MNYCSTGSIDFMVFLCSWVYVLLCKIGFEKSMFVLYCFGFI